MNIWPTFFIFLSIPFTLTLIWLAVHYRPGHRYSYCPKPGQHCAFADHGFVLFGFLAGIVLVLGLWIAAVSLAVSAASCNRLGRNLNAQSEWELIGGCYIQVGDLWVPASVLTPIIDDGRIQVEIVND